MKINEIAAPGSAAAQAGVVARGFGSGLLQKMAFGSVASDTQNSTGANYTQDPQKIISAVTGPVVTQVAKQQQTMWQENVKNLMAQTINPATGKRGTITQADVPLAKLEGTLYRQLAATMQQMSGGRIKDFNDADKLFNDDPETKSLVQQMKTDTERLIGLILMTSPDRKENQRTLNSSWNRISANLAKISALATMKGQTSDTSSGEKTVRVDKFGKVFVGNEPYNAANPEHKAALAKQGLK